MVTYFKFRNSSPASRRSACPCSSLGDRAHRSPNIDTDVDADIDVDIDIDVHVDANVKM